MQHFKRLQEWKREIMYIIREKTLKQSWIGAKHHENQSWIRIQLLKTKMKTIPFLSLNTTFIFLVYFWGCLEYKSELKQCIFIVDISSLKQLFRPQLNNVILDPKPYFSFRAHEAVSPPKQTFSAISWLPQCRTSLIASVLVSSRFRSTVLADWKLVPASPKTHNPTRTWARFRTYLRRNKRGSVYN